VQGADPRADSVETRDCNDVCYSERLGRDSDRIALQVAVQNAGGEEAESWFRAGHVPASFRALIRVLTWSFRLQVFSVVTFLNCAINLSSLF